MSQTPVYASVTPAAFANLIAVGLRYSVTIKGPLFAGVVAPAINMTCPTMPAVNAAPASVSVTNPPENASESPVPFGRYCPSYHRIFGPDTKRIAAKADAVSRDTLSRAPSGSLGRRTKKCSVTPWDVSGVV